MSGTTPRDRLARTIIGLAVPALATLIIEPAFLLVDTAIVASLGTTSLAGLGIAATVLGTVVGVFVFLAYGTTAAVARQSGAGDLRRAATLALDGLWLGCVLGIVVAVALVLTAPAIVGAFGPAPAVSEEAITYLRSSAPGIPGMLVAMAATGVLRGRLDTRTPLTVAAIGFAANAIGCWVAVVVLGWGIAGSGAATAAAQTGMGVALGTVVIRDALRNGASIRPDARGMGAAWRAGVPLLLRTLALRGALVLTTFAAGATGTASLAAHQVVSTSWFLLAMVLDALAIAAQAITGTALGAGDRAQARALVRRLVRWGLGVGVATGVLVAAAAPFVPAAFSSDPQVRSAIVAGLLVVAVCQPLASYVFVLDGILIGAGDGGYLARAMLVSCAVYAPIAVWIAVGARVGTSGLVLVWIGFAGVLMAARAVTLGHRVRSDAWMGG